MLAGLAALLLAFVTSCSPDIVEVGQECGRDNKRCRADHTCIDYKCVETPPCSASKPCNPGRVCYEGRCVPSGVVPEGAQ